MIKYIFYLLLTCLFFCSCEYDNYNPPSLSFEGHFTHNNDSFYYDGNVNNPVLKLYQEGFGLKDYGTVLRVSQHGTFNQLFFAGQYKLTLNNVQYPFEFKDFKSLGVGLGYDSIAYNITKNINQDFEIIPYYTISNVNASIAGNDIVAAFDVNTVTSGLQKATPKVIKAWLYLSTTGLVNSATKCNSVVSIIPFNSGTQHLTATISKNAYRSVYLHNSKTYGWYRVAIELEGIPNYYLFSDTKRIDGIPN
jgi:hypothetical protein